MRNTLKLLTGLVLTTTLTGCVTRQRQYVPPYNPAPAPQPAPFPQPSTALPPGAIVLPQGSIPPSVPPQNYQIAPQQQGQFPTAPPPNNPGFPIQPNSPPPGPMGVVQPNPPQGLGQVGYRWQPIQPVAPPPGPVVLLLPPVPDDDAAPPRPSTGRAQLYPPVADNAPTASAFPVGIPGFDRARENVSTGQRPRFEGLDWLQKNGYRTVVCLHLPGEKTETDREQNEKRGLSFVPMEINPRLLNRDVMEAFLRLIREPAAGKTFVYDKDGTLAGGMWYLSFRVLDLESHDNALVRAGALGLRADGDDVQRELLAAVRKYADER